MIPIIIATMLPISMPWIACLIVLISLSFSFIAILVMLQAANIGIKSLQPPFFVGGIPLVFICVLETGVAMPLFHFRRKLKTVGR